jgi:nucleotidyltransferase/DNA polymerase involved in DNA repair
MIVRHHFEHYHEASEKVMDILNNLTPLVEQISIDEAFLDVTDLKGSAEVLARQLQAAIRDGLGLPCSLGVATNKLVAKIANNIGKTAIRHSEGSPNAVTVVPPGEESVFLAPLPTGELWGVGPKTAERLATIGIKTIGDLGKWPEADLVRRFGKSGTDLSRHARGIDNSPVVTEHETKSISSETTFARDVSNQETLKLTLRGLSEGVGRRLRKNSLSASTIHIKLRWSDFTTLTRQVTLNHATNLDTDLWQAAEELFGQNWPRGKAVRLIGVGASGFDEQRAHQLSLWEDTSRREITQRLQSTLDDLRDKFGDHAIGRASDLKKKRHDQK